MYGVAYRREGPDAAVPLDGSIAELYFECVGSFSGLREAEQDLSDPLSSRGESCPNSRLDEKLYRLFVPNPVQSDRVTVFEVLPLRDVLQVEMHLEPADGTGDISRLNIHHNVNDAVVFRSAAEATQPIGRLTDAYRWSAVAVLVMLRVPAVNHSARPEAQAQRRADIAHRQITVYPFEIRDTVGSRAGFGTKLINWSFGHENAPSSPRPTVPSFLDCARFFDFHGQTGEPLPECQPPRIPAGRQTFLPAARDSCQPPNILARCQEFLGTNYLDDFIREWSD